MTRVGFLGLGAMGAPMAESLIRRQFRVTGYDPRAEAVAALAEAGGYAAATAAEACRDADLVVAMTVNAAQARAALFEAGALAASAPDAIVILMATCPPREVAAMARDVIATGRRFVDAPVSGGVVGARAGTLTIMAAGPDATFDAARPALEAMGDKLHRMGVEPGQGAAMKTVNQLLCGVHLAAAAEGLAFAAKAGVDPVAALAVLRGSAAASWMLGDRGPGMLVADPHVASAVDIFVKDLGIVLDVGRQGGAVTPLAATAHQLFLAASAMGRGREDDSQVIAVYRSLMGLPAPDDDAA